MTHSDNGHYRQKHPLDSQPDQQIVSGLKPCIVDNAVSCVDAHRVAQALNVPPLEVGKNIDLLEIRISKCQLGLFGYDGQKLIKQVSSIPPELEKAILDSVLHVKISCYDVWRIAKQLSIKRLDAACACETLNLKISPCQLGAF